MITAVDISEEHRQMVWKQGLNLMTVGNDLCGMNLPEEYQAR